MAVVIVNDKPVDIGTDKLNLIQAAQRGGVVIPSYCWHPALSVVASCRMCLVEVGDRKPDGSVAMQPKVVPGCQTPAKDGTVILTNSPKAKHAQQQTLESLLLNHPLDCPVCDKAGECLLQDYSYKFGRSSSRMIDAKNLPPNKDYIGEHITLFTDRCIMCSRCVRFTREVSGTAELQVVSRGHHSEIDIFPGEPINNKLSGNVVDLCPVGALCSKDFLYKQRVWFLKDQKSVCPECSTGCSITVDSNKDIVYRLRPRANPQAQGHFMCDEGRFDYSYINARERLRGPLRSGEWRVASGDAGGARGEGRGASGEQMPGVTQAGGATQMPVSWETVIPLVRNEFVEAARRDGAGVGAVLSPYLTCEEAYLLAKFIKGLSKDARLFLGWVPVQGEDDTYPKDRKGRAIQPVKFTIHAEKCPNRRGVEEVLKHFQGEVLYFDKALEQAQAGTLHALYVTAGYPPRFGEWLPAPVVGHLKNIGTLVVQDLMASTASAAAKYVLPAASFAEKDGCFVNHANLCQAIYWAVRPSGQGRTDGQVFLDLLERRGLLHGETLRQELAAEIPFFAPLKDGRLGEYGVRL